MNAHEKTPHQDPCKCSVLIRYWLGKELIHERYEPGPPALREEVLFETDRELIMPRYRAIDVSRTVTSDDEKPAPTYFNVLLRESHPNELADGSITGPLFRGGPNDEGT